MIYIDKRVEVDSDAIRFWTPFLHIFIHGLRGAICRLAGAGSSKLLHCLWQLLQEVMVGWSGVANWYTFVFNQGISGSWSCILSPVGIPSFHRVRCGKSKAVCPYATVWLCCWNSSWKIRGSVIWTFQGMYVGRIDFHVFKMMHLRKQTEDNKAGVLCHFVLVCSQFHTTLCSLFKQRSRQVGSDT